MILPSKYIQEGEAFVGLGAILLAMIGDGEDLSALWDRAKNESSIHNYERFVLTLDFLYLLGLVQIEGNKISKVTE